MALTASGRRPVRYLKRVGMALSQLANAVLGGDEDELLSSRCGKSRCAFCRALCRLLDLIDKGHCAKSIEWDEGRRLGATDAN